MDTNATINAYVDELFEKERTRKDHRELSNHDLIAALSKGKLFLFVIVSRNNNFVSKTISKASGPFVHVACVIDGSAYAPTCPEVTRLADKINQYYKKPAIFKYMVLGSANETGMEYFDASVYEKREMVVFDLNAVSKEDFDGLVREFLSEKIMSATYDYTWIADQLLKFLFRFTPKLARWVVRKLDDEGAYGCSEQAEIFARHNIAIADVEEPNPTDNYRFCKKKYPIVYSSLTKEYA